jgi:hypothetical protein
MCKRSLPQRTHEWWVGAWARCAARVHDQAGNGSALVAALVVLYGLATLGQQDNVPLEFWKQGHLGAVLLVALGALAGLGSFVVTFSVKGLLKRAEIDRELTTSCHEIASFVEARAGAPRGTVGVHVWEIAGPRLARRLRRRATFRAETGNQMPVLWTKGKGVIGQCWADPNVKDQLEDFETLRARAPDERSFCELPASERFNMTWQEFQAGEHYDLIWVTKLYRGLGDAPKLWGLLSVDVEHPGHADSLRKALKTNGIEMRAALNTCEKLLA